VCVREKGSDIIINVDRPPPPRAPTRIKATAPPPDPTRPLLPFGRLLEFTCPCTVLSSLHMAVG
jgi:hypothetical protein